LERKFKAGVLGAVIERSAWQLRHAKRVRPVVKDEEEMEWV